MDAIFAGKNANFESKSAVKKTVAYIMELWNCLNGWNPEKEEIILPYYEYPDSKDGALSRISDAVDLASFFIKGLELGGLSHTSLTAELKENIEQIERIISLIGAQIQLIGMAKSPDRKEIEDAMKAAEKAEFVIDGCITNIYCDLREMHQFPAGPFSKKFSHNNAISSSSRTKVGRNEPCPCGSGKKNKKCCEPFH